MRYFKQSSSLVNTQYYCEYDNKVYMKVFNKWRLVLDNAIDVRDFTTHIEEVSRLEMAIKGLEEIPFE